MNVFLKRHQFPNRDWFHSIWQYYNVLRKKLQSPNQDWLQNIWLQNIWWHLNVFFETSPVSESRLITKHLTRFECFSETGWMSKLWLITKHLTTLECFSETASMSKPWLNTKHLTTLECFFWNSPSLGIKIHYKTSDDTWMFFSETAPVWESRLIKKHLTTLECFFLKQPQYRHRGWLQNIWQHLNVFLKRPQYGNRGWLQNIWQHLNVFLKQPQYRNWGWLQNIWQHLNVFWNSLSLMIDFTTSDNTWMFFGKKLQSPNHDWLQLTKHLTTFECFSETASVSKSWLITKHLTTCESLFHHPRLCESSWAKRQTTSDNSWEFLKHLSALQQLVAAMVSSWLCLLR